VLITFYFYLQGTALNFKKMCEGCLHLQWNNFSSIEAGTGRYSDGRYSDMIAVM